MKKGPNLNLFRYISYKLSGIFIAKPIYVKLVKKSSLYASRKNSKKVLIAKLSKINVQFWQEGTQFLWCATFLQIKTCLNLKQSMSNFELFDFKKNSWCICFSIMIDNIAILIFAIKYFPCKNSSIAINYSQCGKLRIFQLVRFFREIILLPKMTIRRNWFHIKIWVVEKFSNFHTVLREKSSNQRLYTYSFYRINLLF